MSTPRSDNNLAAAVVAMTAVAAAFTLAPYLLQCKHKETLPVLNEATCEEDGLNQTICSKCELVVEEKVIPALGHSYGDYFVSVQPTPAANGIETRICATCENKEEREYLCPHENSTLRTILEPTCSEVGINEAICPVCEHIDYLPIEKLPHAETKSVVFQEPTCSVEGIEHLICIECEAIAEEKPIALLECNWDVWEYDEYATPFESGKRHHTCIDCERRADEEYTITLEKNHIYIPSANILAKFAVSSFTQGAVDSNDIVYTKNAYAKNDPTNPFVLGHWFGSLTTMWHTPVGAYIYINVDGKIDTYEVINSEYAVEMYECYHIGQETGVNVFDTYGSAMNSQYAVYGRNHQGKDLDPENNDGATLHMYTCHNKKDRPGWDPKHGSRGRWIILANLIDSVSISE